MTDIQKRLFLLKDENYKEFQSKLLPCIRKEDFIGVRIPELRRFAKDLVGTPEGSDFLNELPHRYYDENNVHAFMLEQIKDIEECIAQINKFLPYVDNWATCDSLSPEVFKRNKERLYREILLWLDSKNIYTVRFGIKNLITHFCKNDFKSEHLWLMENIDTTEYYVMMAVAWYLATALSLHFEEVLPVIKSLNINKWTFNKIIQKASESLRLDIYQKEVLKSVKIK